jgi:hypothetical protein
MRFQLLHLSGGQQSLSGHSSFRRSTLSPRGNVALRHMATQFLADRPGRPDLAARGPDPIRASSPVIDTRTGCLN